MTIRNRDVNEFIFQDDLKGFKNIVSKLSPTDDRVLQSVSTAISYRRLDFIKFLFFDFGVDLTKSTYPARSPFGDAATGGRMEIVKFFVENIPYDLNEKEDTTGFSLIQSCVSINFDGNQNMIEYLISLGAKYDIPAKNGTTAFYECATCVNLNLAKFFFKLGCNIKQQDRFGDSMMFAVIFNRVKAPIEKQMEMLRWLSENGCDINKPNKTGKSVLSTTIEWNLPELTTFLLSLGANPNFLHPPNKIPLIMQASSRGNFEIVKILHKSGADLKFANSAGIDIVADVVTRGYIEILEYFINVGGCQINTQQSLVAIPCQTGDLKMLKFLVENGASLTAVDLDLIALAKSCEHPHIVKYLQVGMPRISRLKRAFRLCRLIASSNKNNLSSKFLESYRMVVREILGSKFTESEKAFLIRQFQNRQTMKKFHHIPILISEFLSSSTQNKK